MNKKFTKKKIQLKDNNEGNYNNYWLGLVNGCS